MMLAKSQQTIRKTITGADKNFELITHNAGRVTLSSPEEAIGPLASATYAWREMCSPNPRQKGIRGRLHTSP